MDYILAELDKKEKWYVEEYNYDGHIYMTPNKDEAKLFEKREAERIMKISDSFLFMEVYVK